MSEDLTTFDREPGVCFGCGCPAKPGMLMCWPDWRRVPKVIKDDVWRTAGMHGFQMQRPRIAARIAVAVKEGLPVPQNALDYLADYGIGPDGYPLKVTA